VASQKSECHTPNLLSDFLGEVMEKKRKQELADATYSLGSDSLDGEFGKH